VCALVLQYTFPNVAGSGSPVGGTLTPVFSTMLGSETTSPFWCAPMGRCVAGCAHGCVRVR
jgi:hypothetical protein